MNLKAKSAEAGHSCCPSGTLTNSQALFLKDLALNLATVAGVQSRCISWQPEKKDKKAHNRQFPQFSNSALPAILGKNRAFQQLSNSGWRGFDVAGCMHVGVECLWSPLNNSCESVQANSCCPFAALACSMCKQRALVLVFKIRP